MGQHEGQVGAANGMRGQALVGGRPLSASPKGDGTLDVERRIEDRGATLPHNLRLATKGPRKKDCWS